MILVFLGFAMAAGTTLSAQQRETRVAEPLVAATELPESPGSLRAPVIPAGTPFLLDAANQGPSVAPEAAKKYARTIGPGMTAEPWGAKEKFVAAFRKQTSIDGLASPVAVAGWQQIRDSRPHYGTDSGAYGERIGAAYARQSAQSFMNLGVMSSLLHDDPRYYVLGPAHTFRSRVIYAASRVFITRKDNGHNTANIPLFVGVVSSQAMTEGFYPDSDRAWSRTVTGSLGSLAGKMATQQFKEFGAEIRQHIPLLKKK